MKKKLVIITVVLSIGILVGYNKSALNYSKELSNVAKWEATTSNMTGSIISDVEGINEQTTFTFTQYSANNQVYADLNFYDEKGKNIVPEMKLYCDGTTSYINKSYYEGIYTLKGITVPTSLVNVKEEYIAIDNTTKKEIYTPQLTGLIKDPNALTKLVKQLFGNSDINLPYLQNAREYTLNLDAKQTLNLGMKIIASSNNLENLKSVLTAHNIAKIKTAVNSGNSYLKIPDINTVFSGTTITSKKVFTDTSYTVDFNMNLQIKDLGKVSVAMNSTSTESDVKSIYNPTSKIKFTLDEFNKLLDPASTTTNEIEKQVKI